MKVRKNGIEVPKNFSVPPGIEIFHVAMICWVVRRLEFLAKEVGMRCGLALARGVDLEEDGEHQREAPERGAAIAKEGERDADDGDQS